MLNIYYGRESVNKEKFIYDEIERRGYSASSPVIVLVPDQYTLEAERQAFRYTGKDALIGLDIYSISRLGHYVLSKTGDGGAKFIDKYGRQMLLTRVMGEVKDELSVYSGAAMKPVFIEKMNDFISEMKQYGTTPVDLASIGEALGADDALSRKLKDMQKIYAAYDAEISGKYTDSEDYIDLYINAIEDTRVLSEHRVWVYGFDSFAPKSLSVLGALMKVCPEVNVVLTYTDDSRYKSLFELTGKVKDNIKAEALEKKVSIGEERELEGPLTEWESREIEHVESELFAPLPEEYGTKDVPPEDITLVQSANPHNEAESAATYILHLVRDKGYRFRDIVVICNDQEKRAPMLERVFDEYGIPVFRDSKRSIASSGIAVYLVSMFMAVSRRMRNEDVFRALKTGMSVLSQDEVESLENYAISYRIDREMWLKPFTRGRADYDEEYIEWIESIRKKGMAPFEKLSGIMKESATYGDFIRSYYSFLTDDLEIEKELNELIEAQLEAGLTDLSDETAQVFSMITGILEQINDLMGDEAFDQKTFIDLFSMGLRQIEVGVLPQSPDEIMVGTIERTRAGSVKAAVIVGANDGIMPQSSGQGSIFQQDEIERLTSAGHEICKVDKVRRQEERLAMYRNFAKPSSELWISYEIADDQGEALRPSELIEDIKRVFPGIKPVKDVLNSDDPRGLIAGRRSTLRHLADELSGGVRGEVDDPVWNAVYDWYKKNDAGDSGNVLDVLGFENREDPVPETDILLSPANGGDSLSPSRLETYARCPFSYFVGYGLAPQERRVFEAGSREIGDVYHHALMTITHELTESSRWDDITQAELDELIKKVAAEEKRNYRDGLFEYTNDEKYRLTRIEKTLGDSMRILLMHARRGRIKNSYYEEKFGRGRKLDPVEIDLHGKKVYIEGTIDRMDVLENGRVKIMDYKSSSKEINEDLIKAGYRLQLMLYMKAAESGDRKPAGVFYFNIGTKEMGPDKAKVDLRKIAKLQGTGDPALDAAREKVEDRQRMEARMDGYVVNDTETIDQIMGAEPTKDYGPLKVKYEKDGGYSSSSKNYLITEEEFHELEEQAVSTAEKIAGDILEGKIDIHPMKIGREASACKYCGFKGVCRFDPALKGCRYNVVK